MLYAKPWHADAKNRRDFPGGFPGDPHNAFTAGRTAEQRTSFTHVQSLLALRKVHPALRTGKQIYIGWDDTRYAFLRELPAEKTVVVYNNSSESRALEIPVDCTELDGAHEVLSLFGGGAAEFRGGKIPRYSPGKASPFSRFVEQNWSRSAEYRA